MPSTGSANGEARGLVLQHGELGPPGVLAEWLVARDIPFDVHRVWEDGAGIDPAGRRFVASLGSQYSPVDTDPPWVQEELRLLRGAVEQGVPVLGLCFGGQALAVVLGGEMRLAEAPEVAWMPVESRDPARVPTGPWLQFHWEAFTVPPGAQELARTACGAAAFRQGPHLGTQFHPEATPEIAEGWIAAEGRLAAAGVDPAELREQGRRSAGASRDAAFRLFDAWAADALDGAPR